MTDTTGRRPPYGWALLASGSILALYVMTLAPTTAFWDTSEYIATAHILGIPHPPGNPLFVALGKTWSLLLAPLGLSVAVRLNLMAAVTSAAASGFLFLVAHRILSAVFRREAPALIGAATASLVGATAFTVWNQSTVNEKVYTVSVLVMAAVTWLAFRWYDRRDEEGSERLLLWAVFLMALGSTNHLMSVLPAPALALLVATTRPTLVLNGPVMARAVALVAIGVSFNFFLPVRAELDPIINEGDPICESFSGAAAAVFTNGRAGCQALADNLQRTQYRKPPLTERQAPFRAQLLHYWQYFDWQWARGVDASEQPGTGRMPLTLLFAGLGLLGLWTARRAGQGPFVYLVALIATLTVGLVFYLNFEYGYSLYPEVANRDIHEVRERDYFFVASFLFWGLLAGVGLARGWRDVAELAGETPRYLATAPVLLIAFVPLALNWSWASRAGDYAARDWAYDLLMSVEPYGVLFTNGDNDTFPLWYLQEVEGIRKDVTVVVGQYLYTSWYPKQLQALTAPQRQRPYEAAVPGLYENPARPRDSIVSLEPGVMDRVGAYRLDQDVTLQFPELAVTYPAGSVLDRGHQLALAIIHDSIDERPIYFASPGGMMSELGLARWAVQQGLAVKLDLRSLERPREPGMIQGRPEYGGTWMDVPRTLKLYDEVYSFRGLRDRAIWPDRSTLMIPAQYYVLALQLADVAARTGMPLEVIDRLEEDATEFGVLSQGGREGTPDSVTDG